MQSVTVDRHFTYGWEECIVSSTLQGLIFKKILMNNINISLKYFSVCIKISKSKS